MVYSNCSALAPFVRWWENISCRRELSSETPDFLLFESIGTLKFIDFFSVTKRKQYLRRRINLSFKTESNWPNWGKCQMSLRVKCLSLFRPTNETYFHNKANNLPSWGCCSSIVFQKWSSSFKWSTVKRIMLCCFAIAVFFAFPHILCVLQSIFA